MHTRKKYKNTFSRRKKIIIKKSKYNYDNKQTPLNISILDENSIFTENNISIHSNVVRKINVPPCKSVISYLDETMSRNNYIKPNSYNDLFSKNFLIIRQKLIDDYKCISGNNGNYAGWRRDLKSLPAAKYTDRRNIHNHLYKVKHYFMKWRTNSVANPLLIKPTINNGFIFNNTNPTTLHLKTIPKLPIESVPKKKVTIDVSINSIEDLIDLTNKYPSDANIDYNINIQAIHNIIGPLVHLNNMIGIKSVKNSILDQILYYIQDFHNLSGGENDYMHTVIYGPPGTGKTEIAKCIGNIFSKLGILKNGTFKKVTRSDLIAGYLGQTATKTRSVIESSLGGVLFIDEAYALGNNEKGDSFSKECIDTLCEALSDHKKNLMVIIAGYEKELKNCFFDYNQGLESRFTWRFKTIDYDYKELYDIFLKKVTDSGWSISKTSPITKGWFQTNYSYFKYFGRNIETLFSKTKIAHSKRVFCKPLHEKTILLKQDIVNGFEIYKSNEYENDKALPSSSAEHMYV